MKKYINIENTTNTIVRVLSITDSPISPNGLEYIEVDYVERPTTTHMQITYPMYNTNTNTMFWTIIDYQETPTDMLLSLQNANNTINNLQTELLDTQLAVAELGILLTGGTV